MQATCKKNKKHQPSRESSEMEEKLEALGLIVATCSLSFKAHLQGSTGVVVVAQRVT